MKTIIYGHVWSEMPLDTVWTRLDTFGHVWTRLATFGHVWTRIFWTRLDTFGHVCTRTIFWTRGHLVQARRPRGQTRPNEAKIEKSRRVQAGALSRPNEAKMFWTRIAG